MVSGAGSAGAERSWRGLCTEGAGGRRRRLGLEPLGTGPRGGPSLTHPGPRRPGARRLSTAPRRPGSAHPLGQLQLRQPPSHYEPRRLSVASVLSMQQAASRKKPSRGRRRPVAPLPALPAALRPPRAHPCSHRWNADTERRSLAPLRRRSL